MNARALAGLEHSAAAGDEAELPAAACTLPVFDSRDALTAPQWVLDETPVALVYNGISHAVMLATPQELDDFALGFSLSENIVQHRRDVFDIAVSTHGDRIGIALHIAGTAMHRLKLARQARTGRTGCGLCGIDSLEQFDLTTPAVTHGTRVSATALHRAMAALPAHQELHRLTGAAHAAAWAGLDGNLELVREDIGRHNALDKLIGAMAQRGIDPAAGFCVLTSRASYEMVQKAARAGIAVVAAVSAPSALAVRVAQGAGLTLAGFVRNGRHALYSAPERVSAAVI